jgi:hypothetical protein
MHMGPVFLFEPASTATQRNRPPHLHATSQDGWLHGVTTSCSRSPEIDTDQSSRSLRTLQRSRYIAASKSGVSAELVIVECDSAHG